ncbi:hypothetical protein BC938DRAFT_479579 [Jimgerdemannia flammicorona]|uniref:Uncharacterized protein n=1 Tax=Jimgerdemannia flammicorona TaxID=994334 RepID=A0A433QKL1_9FUNG|nr:hypothetical protein BC938DRAFT_479579 [Jimgerdemannia flammicorona]
MDHRTPTTVFSLRIRKVKDPKTRHEEKPLRRKGIMSSIFRRTKKKKIEGRAGDREPQLGRQNILFNPKELRHNSVAPDNLPLHAKPTPSPDLPPYTDDNSLPHPDLADLDTLVFRPDQTPTDGVRPVSKISAETDVHPSPLMRYTSSSSDTLGNDNPSTLPPFPPSPSSVRQSAPPAPAFRSLSLYGSQAAPPLTTLETVVVTHTGDADESELPGGKAVGDSENDESTNSIISSSSTCRNEGEEPDMDGEDKYLSGVRGVRYRSTKERRRLSTPAREFVEPGQEGFVGIDPRLLAKKNEADEDEELNVRERDMPQADDASHDANGLDSSLAESDEMPDQVDVEDGGKETIEDCIDVESPLCQLPLQRFLRVDLTDDIKTERSGLLAGYGVKYRDESGDADSEDHTTTVDLRTSDTFETPLILPFIVGGTSQTQLSRRTRQPGHLPLLFSVVVNVAFVYELSVQVVAHVVEEKVDNRMAGWLRGKFSLVGAGRKRREVEWGGCLKSRKSRFTMNECSK